MQTVTCGVVQVQAVVNSLKGSHNRVEAFVCLYARMVDKDNLWLVLYALKVSPAEHLVWTPKQVQLNPADLVFASSIGLDCLDVLLSLPGS